MPAAHLMGWFGSPAIPGFEWMPEGGCVDAANLAYIGLRDVDEVEVRPHLLHLHCTRTMLATLITLNTLAILAMLAMLAIFAMLPILASCSRCSPHPPHPPHLP